MVLGIYLTIFICLISLIAIIFFNNLVINFAYKHNFLIDSPEKKNHSIHTSDIPRSLGISYLFLLPISFFLNGNNYLPLILVSSFFLIFGLFEDNNKSLKPLYRLIEHFVIIFLFLSFNNDFVLTNIQFLRFIDNYLIYIFISSIFIVALINSINFIDGLNGLCIFYILIITSYLCILKFDSLIFFFILLNLVLLKFNFPNARAFIGDSGSYFLGCFIGLYLIYNFNKNDISNSEWFIANLLAFPISDTTSSIIRRLLIKKSAFYPDNLHLHTLLKIFFNSNSKASFCLFVIVILLLIPTFFFKNHADFLMVYFFFQILIFISSQKILQKILFP